MSGTEFSRLVQTVFRLDHSLDRLRDEAEQSGVPSPEHDEWHALLKHKLIPQLNDKTFLIVAVMGGTNTGKSLLFNHLVGEHRSAVDHRAAGTKHPVCLAPLSADSLLPLLQRLFEHFHLVRWEDAAQPLEPSEEHRLFWMAGQNVPESLLLLDTPDIDSDVEVNWERAKHIRHAADVVLAILTEQKYNDAVVRRFFREAAEAGKPVIVLFNMFDVKTDGVHLPHWIEQFCDETKVKPLALFVVPRDRTAAENRELPFYEYSVDGTSTSSEPVDLRRILGELHFDTIKTQTLLGAVRQLDDPETGIPAYLRRVESAAERFTEALRTLENVEETAVVWPGLPTFLLVEEIRNWWNTGRPGWSQTINNVYRMVGNSLVWPIRKATAMITDKPSVDPMDDFRAAEYRVVGEFVAKVIDRLETLGETSNPILRREILDLIGGEQRARLVERAHRTLESLPPIDGEFRELLHRRLTDWATEYPLAVGWIRSVDNVATVARPMITVSLALSGFAFGATAVTQAALASGMTVGGETLLHVGSEGVRQSAAKLFRKIQEDFVTKRSGRFYEQFHAELWNSLIERLRTGAKIVDSEPFRDCKVCLGELR